MAGGGGVGRDGCCVRSCTMSIGFGCSNENVQHGFTECQRQQNVSRYHEVVLQFAGRRRRTTFACGDFRSAPRGTPELRITGDLCVESTIRYEVATSVHRRTSVTPFCSLILRPSSLLFPRGETRLAAPRAPAVSCAVASLDSRPTETSQAVASPLQPVPSSRGCSAIAARSAVSHKSKASTRGVASWSSLPWKRDRVYPVHWPLGVVTEAIVDGRRPSRAR